MHFRRKRPRHGHTARERSSDWRYPQYEKGSLKRSKASIRRWIEKTMQSFKEWNEVRS